MACDSVWVINPPPDELLERYYDNEVHKRTYIHPVILAISRWQALARWHFIIDTLKDCRGNLPSERISVCDIGAGLGCALEVGKNLGLDLDYYATEYSARMGRRIEALGGNVLVGREVTEFEKKFDLVWASHILEHCSSPDDLLQRIKEMMKPEGIGFIEVPYRDYEFKEYMDSHLLSFSMKGLRATLDRNGFNVIKLASAGTLRKRAKQLVGRERRYRKMLKKLFPRSFVSFLRLFYYEMPTALSSFLDSKKKDLLKKTLEDTSLRERYQLESYGGDRSVLRVVFSRPGM